MSSTTPDQPANDFAAAALPVSAAGQITTVLVIVLFILFMIALVLYLRTKRCPGTFGSLSFASASASPICCRRPLELSVLGSLPVTSVRLRDFVDPESGLDRCAVCLSELIEGEKARFLPKCGHGFHVGCIDVWFASNSTCPLCRLPVDVLDEGSSSTAPCSSPEKQEKRIVLVIDIPEAPSPSAPLEGLRSDGN